MYKKCHQAARKRKGCLGAENGMFILKKSKIGKYLLNKGALELFLKSLKTVIHNKKKWLYLCRGYWHIMCSCAGSKAVP